MESSADRSDIRLCRLEDCTFRQAVELWNAGFSGYYSDMTTTVEKFAVRLGRESIRPDLSVAAFAGDEPAGFVLVALKEAGGVKIAWNGGTGVSPACRGRGLAKRLMREAVEAMKRGGAELAYLEVVQQNAGAVAVYESVGFRIVDGLIGAKRTGPVGRYPQADDENGGKEGYTLSVVKPRELTRLPFFRFDAAWSGQWFNRAEDDGIVVSGVDGKPLAYALVRRAQDEDGALRAVTLYHCAADPALGDRRTGPLHAALEAAFGPAEADCARATDNLSMSDPAVVEWLKAAGFETAYTQYLMKAAFGTERRDLS
ncbi:GNAT family N-acetyltransferase [Paenibacillus flagellatus]|nr:GNAT family N-acetyltransferase [Paenibacillus flagellatus]